MRIVFLGSGGLGRAVLAALLDEGVHDVVSVVSRPDRPAGRHRRLRECPVKELARRRGLPVLECDSLRAEDIVARLRELRPDVMVTADFGIFIPPEVLELPPRGVINVHPSLLPKYRGAAPVQWAIAKGEKTSGVSVLFVTEEMDAGDIILQESVSIGPDETAPELMGRLEVLGAELLLRALHGLEKGKVAVHAQKSSEATFAPRLKKEDGLINWSLEAAAIHNRIRGFQPWPGCYTSVPGLHGGMLHVRRSRVEENGGGRPGEVIEIGRDGPLLGTGRGGLRVLAVQPPGKPVMSAAAFLCGHRVSVGDVWGWSSPDSAGAGEDAGGA